MRYKIFLLTSLALIVGMLFGAVTPVLAGGVFEGQIHCEAFGGIWLGPDDIGGLCKGGIPFYECNMVVSYSPGTVSWTDGGNACNAHNSNRLKMHGEDEGGDFEYKDWIVMYGDGTCAEKCSASRKLPQSAQESIPGEASSWIYLQAGGSYDVCYPGIGMIYTFVGGAWQPANYQHYVDRTCVFGASGDASFAFIL